MVVGVKSGHMYAAASDFDDARDGDDADQQERGHPPQEPQACFPPSPRYLLSMSEHVIRRKTHNYRK